MGIREDDSLAFALQAVAGATLSTQVLVVITTISSILSLLKVTENMVHPGGFEPPTARFVAEYSIQLSYGCIGKIYFTADIDIATKARSFGATAKSGDFCRIYAAVPLITSYNSGWVLRRVSL